MTLEENGEVRFPDAPTERGVKHLRGLQRAAAQGHRAAALFLASLCGKREGYAWLWIGREIIFKKMTRCGRKKLSR